MEKGSKNWHYKSNTNFSKSSVTIREFKFPIKNPVSNFSLKCTPKQYLRLQLFLSVPKRTGHWVKPFHCICSLQGKRPIIKWMRNHGLPGVKLLLYCRFSETLLYVIVQCRFPKRNDPKQCFLNVLDHCTSFCVWHLMGDFCAHTDW